MPSSELSELHHLFIHAMLLRRVAPYEKWLEIWKKIAGLVGVRVIDHDFSQFYGELNDRIESFGFRIDLISDEGIGRIDLDQLAQPDRRLRVKRWMALVNTRSDEIAKLGTEFSSNEISLYKKIVDRIILSPNYRYCISYHDAIRLSSSLESVIKKSDAEKLLGVLVTKGWLSQSSTGQFSLSVRAKLELKSYIDENYNEEDRPPSCAGCREMVMRGFKCPNSECPKAMHVVCAANQARHSNTCPSCKSPFNYNTKIGEDAPKDDRSFTQYDDDDDDDDDEGDVSATQATSRSVKRSHRQSNTNQLDGDDEEPATSQTMLSQSQVQSQPPRKSNRRR